jgi:hypothetical protein
MTEGDYIRHAERFGPECVFETAVRDRSLSKHGLGQLKAWLDSRNRSYYWQVGRAGGPDSQWRPRVEKPRQCEFCGLDLPPDALPKTRFHSHCGQTARQRRHRERHGATSAQANAVTGSAAPVPRSSSLADEA